MQNTPTSAAKRQAERLKWTGQTVLGQQVLTFISGGSLLHWGQSQSTPADAERLQGQIFKKIITTDVALTTNGPDSRFDTLQLQTSVCTLSLKISDQNKTMLNGESFGVFFF